MARRRSRPSIATQQMKFFLLYFQRIICILFNGYQFWDMERMVAQKSTNYSLGITQKYNQHKQLQSCWKLSKIRGKIAKCKFNRIGCMKYSMQRLWRNNNICIEFSDENKTTFNWTRSVHPIQSISKQYREQRMLFSQILTIWKRVCSVKWPK